MQIVDGLMELAYFLEPFVLMRAWVKILCRTQTAIMQLIMHKVNMYNCKQQNAT